MRTKHFLWLTMICWSWAGMIAAISFMEAPVKFTAPSLTMQVGVDVGRHVFGAFNKVELALCALLILVALISKIPARKPILPFAIALSLLLETAWLLPALDQRAIKVIAGETPPSTYHHILYVVFELVKLTGLIISGVTFFKASNKVRLQENE